jgi:hypothetical protein
LLHLRRVGLRPCPLQPDNLGDQLADQLGRLRHLIFGALLLRLLYLRLCHLGPLTEFELWPKNRPPMTQGRQSERRGHVWMKLTSRGLPQ